MISHFSQPCIFLWRRRERHAVPPSSPLYTEKLAKSWQPKNFFHCTPAIITRPLDHCQGLFLLPGSGARGSMRRPYSRQSARGCSIGQEWGRGFYPSVSGSRAFPGVLPAGYGEYWPRGLRPSWWPLRRLPFPCTTGGRGPAVPGSSTAPQPGIGSQKGILLRPIVLSFAVLPCDGADPGDSPAGYS